VVKLRDQLVWFVHDITPQLQGTEQGVTPWAGMLE
jgi:hypothetical protein